MTTLLITAAGDELALNDHAMITVIRDGETKRVPAGKMLEGDMIEVSRVVPLSGRRRPSHPFPPECIMPKLTTPKARKLADTAE